MSILSRRDRALFIAALPLAAAAFSLLVAPVPEAGAAPICAGGQVIQHGGSVVGCRFPTWGPAEQLMCVGAVYVPPEDPTGCHVCVVAPLDIDILDPSKWPSFTPSDFSCRLHEPVSHCEDGRFCDEQGCRELDDPFSVVMCQCELADAACGVGLCIGDGYCEGGGCAAPVCYSPDTDISRALCGGASISYPECEVPCQPHTDVFEAGVDDDFSTGNGPEVPSPSGALLTHIANVYAFPGSRKLDKIGQDRWFAHTFTGIAPGPGEYICGARLVTRIGHGQGSLSANDSLGLFFMDQPGHQLGTSFWASLSSLGVAGGSSALVTLDLASLPGGQDLLADLAANGWLDMIVQDDSAVDFARLEIDYCCGSPAWTPWLERDIPGGQGDYETLADFLAAGLACPNPIGIECQTTSGVDWTLTGDVYTCDPAIGGVCVNADQPDGACENYQVRFLCP